MYKSFLQEVWMIGGVHAIQITEIWDMQPGHISSYRRNVEKFGVSCLVCGVDNYPAIWVYEKIGYKKIGEKLWVDVGTGLKP
jgi:hypothetical protein